MERYVLSWEAPLCLLSGESEALCIIQHCRTYTIALDEWIVSMRKHTPLQGNRHTQGAHRHFADRDKLTEGKIQYGNLQ